MANIKNTLLEPVVTNNPIALQILGICSALAVTSSMKVSFVMCICLLYTSPSPRDQRGSRMPSSA